MKKSNFMKKMKKARIAERLRRALYGPLPKNYYHQGAVRGAIVGDLLGLATMPSGAQIGDKLYLGHLARARAAGGLIGHVQSVRKTNLAKREYRRRVARRNAAGLLGAGGVGGAAYLATQKKQKKQK